MELIAYCQKPLIYIFRTSDNKTLPKDIADMHLAGEINISNTGLWGLIPDTVFLDVD